MLLNLSPWKNLTYGVPPDQADAGRIKQILQALQMSTTLELMDETLKRHAQLFAAQPVHSSEHVDKKLAVNGSDEEEHSSDEEYDEIGCMEVSRCKGADEEEMPDGEEREDWDQHVGVSVWQELLTYSEKVGTSVHTPPQSRHRKRALRAGNRRAQSGKARFPARIH